jgi:hypothetical protein
MGKIDACDADEILDRLFREASEDDRNTLDKTIQDWLKEYLGPVLSSLSSIPVARWITILRDALSTVAFRLNLIGAQKWLLENQDKLRVHELNLAPSRNTIEDLEWALRLSQKHLAEW